MDTFRCMLTFLLASLTLAAHKPDPFETLVAYEAKQRATFGVGDSHYRLLPFRVSHGETQHFLQTPTANQTIQGQVVVHWISQNASLHFPSFDLTQKVRLIIEEETLSAAPFKPVLTKEFLTQTGFRVSLEGGRRYRWRVQSSGREAKLVQIATITKPQEDSFLSKAEPKKDIVGMELFKQVKEALDRVSTVRSISEQKPKGSKLSEMWALMSGLQMLSLLSVVLIQLVLFQKMSLPRSVV